MYYLTSKPSSKKQWNNNQWSEFIITKSNKNFHYTIFNIDCWSTFIKNDLKSCQNGMWKILHSISPYFSKKQYARRSHVTFFAYSFKKQRARSSCVTSQAIIPSEKAREIVLRYISSCHSLREGTRDVFRYLKKHNILQRWSNPRNFYNQQYGSTI